MPALMKWFERLFASTPSRDAERLSAEQVLTKHAGRLLQVRGVMSMGVGKDSDGRPAIVIGISSEIPDAVGELPETLDGIRVVQKSS
ncbi:MAG: hypothetical protein CVT66_06930 [Actinobacteria bacterium HGW-Actinobacteria-6]|nr:MAG: hypothetical protein CVT66_06930 [Actinobacteria bacterium HGW-Actinobacteria-6]